MEGLLVRVVACALIALALGAAPPPRPSDDPEPPKVVYHLYYLIIQGDKRSPEELRKFLAPLVLARFDLMTTDEMAIEEAKEGVHARQYRVWIRTRDSYEKVQAVIKGKPGVTRIWLPSIHVAKKTVDRVPVPIVRDGKSSSHQFYVPVPKN